MKFLLNLSSPRVLAAGGGGPEVPVEPGVQDRVGARRRHSHQMTNREHQNQTLLVL